MHNTHRSRSAQRLDACDDAFVIPQPLFPNVKTSTDRLDAT